MWPMFSVASNSYCEFKLTSNRGGGANLLLKESLPGNFPGLTIMSTLK